MSPFYYYIISIPGVNFYLGDSIEFPEHRTHSKCPEYNSKYTN